MDWGSGVNPVVGVLATQLAVQLPLLLVSAVGVVLALAFWRRCPAASLLVLLAAGLLALSTVGQTCLTVLLVHSRRSSGMEAAALGRILSLVAVVGVLMRAAAVGLLLAGAFVGRRRAPASDH